MTVQIHIFLGYRQTKEMKKQLIQSSSWNEEKILGQSPLVETSWESHEYIGCYIPSLINCKMIAEKEKEIKSKLQLYCPKLILDKQHFYLFPQIFLH